jgi:hypothetical protein
MRSQSSGGQSSCSSESDHDNNNNILHDGQSSAGGLTSEAPDALIIMGEEQSSASTPSPVAGAAISVGITTLATPSSQRVYQTEPLVAAASPPSYVSSVSSGGGPSSPNTAFTAQTDTISFQTSPPSNITTSGASAVAAAAAAAATSAPTGQPLHEMSTIDNVRLRKNSSDGYSSSDVMMNIPPVNPFFTQHYYDSDASDARCVLAFLSCCTRYILSCHLCSSFAWFLILYMIRFCLVY